MSMEHITFQYLLRDGTDLVNTLVKYEELEMEIKQLTGFNLKQLKALFAMGFTLKRPEYDLSINQLTTLAELGLEWRN